MKQWLINARVFTGQQWLPQAHVGIIDDCIATVQPGPLPPEAAPAPVFDCAGQALVPAFTDLQVYGAQGRLFSQYPDTDSLAALAHAQAQQGTAHSLVTIATQPLTVVHQCLRAVSSYLQQGGSGIAGLHLEGPFIHPERRGAHRADWVRVPTPDDIRHLLDVAAGSLKMMTLAPECCSDEVLRLLRDAGVLLSAGHSNASYQQAMQFASRGIQLVTHLYNAMSPLQHRQPGLALAALLHTGLHASIIPDGVHVHPAMLQLAHQVMGDRLFFITDAVTQCTEGPYQHYHSGTHYTLPDGTLSGSAISMLQGVQLAMQQAGLSATDALRKAATLPARWLGIQAELAPGAPAQLLLLSADWQLVRRFGF